MAVRRTKKSQSSKRGTVKSSKKRSKASRPKRRGVNIARMREEAEVRAAERKAAGTKLFTCEEGTNILRFLPPWKEEGETFYRKTFIHYNVPPGADRENSRSVMCTKETAGRCYVCEQISALYASGDDVDVEFAKEMGRRKQFFSNVIDLDDKWDIDPSKKRKKGPKKPKVQVFRYGTKILDQLLAYFCDNDYGDITDVDEGRNITITRIGTDIKTEYTVSPGGKPTSVEDFGIDADAVFELMPDLDQLGTVSSFYGELDYDAQASVYEGEPVDTSRQLTTDADDEDEDEEYEGDFGEDEDEEYEDEEYEDDEEEEYEDEEEEYEDEDEEDFDDEDFEDEDFEDFEDEDDDEEEEEEDDADELEDEMRASVRNHRRKSSKKAATKKKAPAKKKAATKKKAPARSKKLASRRRRK